MSDRKKSFRFRLPWLSAPPPPPPPPRPAVESQPRRRASSTETSPEKTGSAPIQRPPFRSGGKATTQRAQSSKKTELPRQPKSQVIETEVSTKSASPSRAPLQPRATSQQRPSPSRSTTQAQVAASLPPSLSQTALKQPAEGTAPQPQTPSTAASLSSEATSITTVSEHSTPSPKSKTTRQESEPTIKPTQAPELSLQQQVSKPEPSQQLIQEPQPSVETPSPNLADETSPQKSDSINSGPKSLSESQRELEGSKKDKRDTREFIYEGKTSSTARPHEKTITEMLTGTSNKQQEKQEFLGRKETTTKDVKVRTTVNTSTRKPLASKDKTSSLQKEIREGISTFVQKLPTVHVIEENQLSVITLTGDNKGASMRLGSESARKGKSIHIRREYKTIPDESPETTTEAEGRERSKEEPEEPLKKEDEPSKAFINSNAQSINDSIVFDSSITQRDPGVHLVLPYDSIEPNISDGISHPLQTHKAECTTTPAENRTYESRVRRRCLRGLLMESSDSDQDDPEKPLRHGCRYNCK